MAKNKSKVIFLHVKGVQGQYIRVEEKHPKFKSLEKYDEKCIMLPVYVRLWDPKNKKETEYEDVDYEVVEE